MHFTGCILALFSAHLVSYRAAFSCSIYALFLSSRISVVKSESIDSHPAFSFPLQWWSLQGFHASWKVMEFKKGIFQAWKVMENEMTEVMESHGKVVEFQQ